VTGRLRIGIDVGGTNTDGVLMREREVIAATKSATTDDIASGIVTTVERLLADARVSAGEVSAVMIGTTQFTNALVQRRGLASVLAVRMCLPADTAIPIAAGWPSDLVAAIDLQHETIHGGVNFDGGPIAEPNQDEIARLIERLRETRPDAVAITSVFSTVDPAHETALAEQIGVAVPGIGISLGSRVGRIGLLERENAAILNAALMPLARRVVSAYEGAFESLGVRAPIFISQNDGTVMQGSHAQQYPVRTLASGPTNSMRGAAFLSGYTDALVLDVGGTTSDIGALVGGFPRQAPSEFDLDGVRTNFRMPDVSSLGLGGGSLVRSSPDGVRIGPDSVGNRLVDQAIVFGGTTLTVTDVAVALGRAAIGEPERAGDLDRVACEEAFTAWHERLDDLVSVVRGRSEPMPLILVGGGAFIVDGDRLEGITEVVRPPFAAMANAVGAAIPQASGEVDRVVELGRGDRDEIIERLRDEARSLAVQAGASPATVEIVEEDTTQLTELGAASLRVRVKAVGLVELAGLAHAGLVGSSGSGGSTGDTGEVESHAAD
jgi:N-methylhydantoinase A/oxoprolinase/acetone carboxylase beta subunit